MTTLIPQFEQTGSSTNRPFNLKLQEVISVKDFGATGNGTTDDTTAIQNAINEVNSLGGGIVFFPAGTYLVSSTLTVSSGVTLHGTGPQGSFITTASATLNVINITGSYTGVNNIGFKTTASARTAGSYIIAAGQYCYINNFYMSKPYVGITVTGIFTFIKEGLIEDITSRNTTTGGASFVINVSGEADCYLDSIICRINNTTTSTWPSYVVNWVDGTVFHAQNCEFLQADIGLNVAPTSGIVNLGGRFTSCYFDTILSHCAIIDPQTTSGEAIDINFTSCEFGANGGNGLSITQTNSEITNQIDITSCTFNTYVANSGTGLYVTTNASQIIDLNVVNSRFGFIGSGFQDGISINNACNYTINGCDASYNARYGIHTQGSSNIYVVVNNRATSNGTANVLDAATGSTKNVSGNIG
jgi:hypothetical protein